MIPRFKPDLGWAEISALFRPNRGAVERFEKEFAKAFQAVDAVAFPYGRSAQWAFFKAMGIENAEIIMPAYTCSVVAHAVTLSGNTPRFIDITLDDYNMDLDAAEAAISEKTRAIIATHTFGYPQDLDRLEAMVKRAEDRYGHKIWLMQDCCHAFGAEWKGRMIGTSGDVAVYAFNISKLMTSVFGGMLTFQNKSLAEKVRTWRNHNFKPTSMIKEFRRRFYLLAVYIAFQRKFYKWVWWLQTKTSLLDRWTRAYHLDEKIHFPPGSLDQMLAIEAQVGLIQLQKYADIVKHRQKNARFYDEQLRERVPWLLPPIVEGATYSHYVVRVPDRQDVMRKMLRDGIELGQLIEYSIPHISVYSPYALNTEYPNSLISSQMTINLPLHKNIKKEHLIRITKLITDNFGVSSA
jgi:dTDP-4-amino-4,6-dideoxygalactose transaminase